MAQPLLAAGVLPGLPVSKARKWHRAAGITIAVLIALHVGGLYWTSPPDALDALLLVSPTPFSVFGVIAMWGIVLTVALVALRRKLRLRYPVWHVVHNVLVVMVVIATLIHALQIDGLMEPYSKAALCGLVGLVTCAIVFHVRFVRPRTIRREAQQKA